jgi:hypothetical protein
VCCRTDVCDWRTDVCDWRTEECAVGLTCVTGGLRNVSETTVVSDWSDCAVTVTGGLRCDCAVTGGLRCVGASVTN